MTDSGREDQSAEVANASTGERPPVEFPPVLDDIVEALVHPRRRYLCYTLLENVEWTLSSLATKVAAWEDDVPEHEVTDDQRERVYVSLYHAHVPKLVDEGIVTFDEETERITAAENADRVLSVLEGLGASVDSSQEAHARKEIDDG